jgi:ribonuclease HII
MTPHPRDRAEIPHFPSLACEQELWQRGLTRLAGLDEAGRGAWAGPVAAGAVILPPDPQVLELLSGVRDSKQMTARAREMWARRIQEAACAWAVGMADCEEIDAIGILPATRLAMRRALERLSPTPQHLLIDALHLPGTALPQTALIHGDASALSIAAASVLAKTARDALMEGMGAVFPEYGFARHKGYGTRAHQEALAKFGPCSQHRRSFAPVKSMLMMASRESGEIQDECDP